MNRPPSRSPHRLPLIAVGLVLGALVCGAGAAAIGWLVFRSDAGTMLSRTRAATSGKGHKDGYSAPAGYTYRENAASILTLRAIDQAIIDGFVGRDLGSPAREDAVPGDARADLFQEPAAGTLTGVALDLDRDGRWDERWEVSGTRVIRRISPDQDESFPLSYRLKDGLWLGDP